MCKQEKYVDELEDFICQKIGKQNFLLSMTGRAQNFRSSHWLRLSVMSAYSWERADYNQQLIQIKHALQCKSKSMHWLQAV